MYGEVWTQEFKREQEMVWSDWQDCPAWKRCLCQSRLDHVKGLTWVQEAWFIPESIPKLKVVDAEWMPNGWRYTGSI